MPLPPLNTKTMVLALSAAPARLRVRTHLVKSQCMRQPFRTESFLNNATLRAVSLLAAVVVGCLGLIVTTFIRPCVDCHLPLGTVNAASLRAHRLTARAVDAEVVETQNTVSVKDLLLPIGPSCPFRSSMMEGRGIDTELASIMAQATAQSGNFEQLAAQFSAGVSPDPYKVRAVADGMRHQGRALKEMLDGVEHSSDFQAIETYYTLEASARKNNVPSFRTVERFVNWQADGLVAFSQGLPLPPLPFGVDPVALQSSVQDAKAQNRVHNLNPNLVRELPYHDADFEGKGPAADEVKAVYEKLIHDQKDLVGLGETYGDFDPAGKDYYLTQIEQLPRRWEKLMKKAQKAGINPNPRFMSYSYEYLQRAGLTATQFTSLVKDVYWELRKQVEVEKAM